MSAAEQFVLTLSERGYGKRTSSYEYRITGRGGKGIVAMAVNEPQRPARRRPSRSRHADQIMLVTNGGQLIRVPVDGIRIVGPRHAGRHASSTPARRARRLGRAHRGRGGRGGRDRRSGERAGGKRAGGERGGVIPAAPS